MRVRETIGGVKRLEFDDASNNLCILQQSDVREDCIYFEIEGTRMYLARRHVEELLPVLSRFVGTGNLSIS